MGENINNIKNLLQNISTINREYDKKSEKSGENFNVFSVMNMEHSEVNTHSAIIGELLNPNGSHGQEGVFLKLFIDEIKKTFGSEIENKHINKLKDFDTLVKENICERTISLGINWENVTGGRIDLIVEDHKQILIIENKLYAIDQPLQLIRYDNYAKTKGKEYHILYLTLFGKKLEKEEKLDGIIRGYNFIHTEISKYNKIKEEKSNIHSCLYYPITFEVHIRDWIRKCIEIIEPHSKPLLKATLEQYLTLIKKITFQTMSEEMKKEIVDSILMEPIRSENVRSAFAIVVSIEKLKRKLYYKFIDNLHNKIGFEKINGLEVIDITDDPEYCGVYFNFGDFEKNTIGLFFGSNKEDAEFSENVFLGFRKKESLKDLINKFENLKFESDNEWIWKRPEYSNWGNTPEIWEDISLGEKGKTYNEIIKIIEEIITI